jgi:hypothetical protein
MIFHMRRQHNVVSSCWPLSDSAALAIVSVEPPAIELQGSPLEFLNSVEAGDSASVRFEICPLIDDGAVRPGEAEIVSDQPVESFDVTNAHGGEQCILSLVDRLAQLVASSHDETIPNAVDNECPGEWRCCSRHGQSFSEL